MIEYNGYVIEHDLSHDLEAQLLIELQATKGITYLFEATIWKYGGKIISAS